MQSEVLTILRTNLTWKDFKLSCVDLLQVLLLKTKAFSFLTPDVIPLNQFLLSD